MHTKRTFVTLVGGKAQPLTAAVHSARAREAIGDLLPLGQVAIASLGAGELAAGLGSVGAVVPLGAGVQPKVGDVGGAEVAGGAAEALRSSCHVVVGAPGALQRVGGALHAVAADGARPSLGWIRTWSSKDNSCRLAWVLSKQKRRTISLDILKTKTL